MRRTKIVATLGPASESPEMIEALIQAGMNVVRLNFSHGSYDNHAMLIDRVRAASKKMNTPIAIMQDLQGPKIRVGSLPEGGIELQEKMTCIFDTALDVYTDTHIPVDFKELHTSVKVGESILLDDGKLEVRVLAVTGTRIDTEVVHGGTLTSHKGMNLPQSHIQVRSITQKDIADLRFGIEHGVDLVAISFVQSPEDVIDVKEQITQMSADVGDVQPTVRVIAKIERPQAVERIREILAVTDGIMVARGDLGLETPAAEVPIVQKKLIALALEYAKPVIVATQMLDSMQHSARPTRAEVSDVANAVIDHTDAVMLSNETATGEFPLEAVSIMRDIIEETERSSFDTLPLVPKIQTHTDRDALAESARILAENVDAKAILVASVSGQTGRQVSRYRPELPILVSTTQERVMRQLSLSWGVTPSFIPSYTSVEELIDALCAKAIESGIVKKGDKVIVVAGDNLGVPDTANILEVQVIGNI